MRTLKRLKRRDIRDPRKRGSGIFIGRNAGFTVRKIVKKRRAATRKSHVGPHTLLARSVIREVSGYAAYEKRIMELLRNGLERKALRLAKKKLGTHQRAKKKRDELSNIIRKQKLAKPE